MEYGVLGPLEIRRADAPVPLPRPREQRLLSLLLLSPNRSLSMIELVHGLWCEDAPATARRQVQNSLSRLRQWLRTTGGCADRLAADRVGCRLTVEPGKLDSVRFQELVAEADTLPPYRCAERARGLRAALSLWRGPAFAGITGPGVEAGAARLGEQRLAAYEQCIEAELSLGRHRELIGEIRELLALHPLRERLVGQLMVALYRSGRQGEALQAYQRLARQLGDQLGADPGGALQELHVAILRQELPPTAAPAPAGSAGAGQEPTPLAAPVQAHRQLPPDLSEFHGREAELRWLTGELRPGPAGEPVTSVRICVIEGMAGVGKTRLAVRAAHQLVAAGRFADTQLYVDLHGHADRPPADPAAVLGSFLHLLGVAPEQVPPDLAGRCALYRDRLHGRRALVLLDNAASEAQVRPLLPADPANLVLVTSRRTLVLDGASPLHLDVFRPQEAIDLLAGVAGGERVRAEPAAARQVVDRCGRLPFAVTLMARRLQARPAWTMADAARRLADRGHRLAELACGNRALRDVFELSYQALAPGARRVFRMLGLHPGEDVTASSTAALTGLAVDAARRILDRLVDERLLAAEAGDRYRLHDLLRDYARELAVEDGEGAARAALGRLLGWYVDAAATAQRLLFSAREPLPEPATPAEHRPRFPDQAAALAWLTAERANLLAASTAALEHGLWEYAWQLPAAMRHYFLRSEDWQEWVRFIETGLAGARAAGDRQGEALLLNDLGIAHSSLGDHERGVDLLTRAVAVSRQLPDRAQEARARNNLAAALGRHGRSDLAVAQLEAALGLVRAAGEPVLAARTLGNLGHAHLELGDYTAATGCLRSTAAVLRGAGDTLGLAQTLANLGCALRQQGEPEEALPVLLEACRLLRELRLRAEEADALLSLAQTLADTGAAAEAAQCRERAEALLAESATGWAEEVQAATPA